MSLTRRAILGLVAGLPFALKAGAVEAYKGQQIDWIPSFDDMWLHIKFDPPMYLGPDMECEEVVVVDREESGDATVLLDTWMHHHAAYVCRSGLVVP